MHQLTATKDFKHPETREMVRAGEPTEMSAENAKLYRRLGAVKAKVAATPPVTPPPVAPTAPVAESKTAAKPRKRTTKKRATAKK